MATVTFKPVSQKYIDVYVDGEFVGWLYKTVPFDTTMKEYVWYSANILGLDSSKGFKTLEDALAAIRAYVNQKPAS